MSSQTRAVRLPLLQAALAALLLLAGTGVLLVVLPGQSTNTERQRMAQGLSETAEQLTAVVASGSANGAANTEWAQSDRLARLVAAGDVQVAELVESYGVLNFLSATEATAADEVNADWKMLREGLLSFNRSMLDAVQSPQGTQDSPSIPLPQTPQAPQPQAQTPQIQTQVPQSVRLLAADFAEIRSRVTEGTRVQPLIDLVDRSSLLWAQIVNSTGADLQVLITEQQINADELLRLSAAGTGSSLYGYYTSDLILNFVQRVKDIQLPASTTPSAEPPVIVEQVVVDEPVVRENGPAARVAAGHAFVTEALVQLQASNAEFLHLTAKNSTRTNLIKWLALVALAIALLLLLAALWQMMRAAKAVHSLSTVEKDTPATAGAAKVADTAAARIPASTHDRSANDRSDNDRRATDRSAMADHPTAAPARNGAMSVREADQLIDDINAIASGDLRHAVRVPRHGQGKAIAESANRTASVVQNLVGMTRGVASRIEGVVLQSDRLGQSLAEQDIRRQSETAELSDSISVRSALLDKQRLVLSASGELIKELETRAGSAVNGVNEVSSSLARVSAQVEVSNGRLQSLLQTAGEVTQSSAKLKLLAEQARLQALNVSLKMPEQVRHRTYDVEIAQSDTDSDNASNLFEDIHRLTGQLVQLSGDTAALVTLLKTGIEETAQSLNDSKVDINESARHTHTSSLVGKELGSYCDQLQRSIKDALSNIEAQKEEMSQTAGRIVQLDKTGNRTSEMTLVLTQDVAELQTMAKRLQESVAGFTMDGSDSATDTGTADHADSATVPSDRATAERGPSARGAGGGKSDSDKTGSEVRGEAPLA